MEEYEELLKQNCKRLDADDLLDFYDKIERAVKHLEGFQRPPRDLISGLRQKQRSEVRVEIRRRMHR